MKRKWKAAAGMLLCGLVIMQITVIGPIREAFIGAEQTCLKIGTFTSDTGTTADMSQKERDACIQTYEANLEQYYAEGNASREYYAELNRSYVQDVFRDTVQYLVHTCVINCIVIPVGIGDGGKTVTIMASWKAQNIWVDQEEDGSYSIVAPVSNCNAKAVMVKEQGGWKLLRHENFTALENNRESVVKEGYTTFAHALQAAEDLRK
ncbi:MAG: hypothetical protein LUE11_00860 [Clostridia bacterium]|nr:hypothetical protein [Clostridia bacterium]